MVQYSTVRYNTVKYSTVQYNTVLYIKCIRVQYSKREKKYWGRRDRNDATVHSVNVTSFIIFTQIIFTQTHFYFWWYKM